MLNWNRLRAPASPYFLRSLPRGSRVSIPAFFSGARSSGFASTRARAIPRRSAPACPEMPPPAAVAEMSYLSVDSRQHEGLGYPCPERRRGKTIFKRHGVDGKGTRYPIAGIRVQVDVLRRPVP